MVGGNFGVARCRVRDLEGSQRSREDSEREVVDAAAMREVEALRQKVVQLELDIAGATAHMPAATAQTQNPR